MKVTTFRALIPANDPSYSKTSLLCLQGFSNKSCRLSAFQTLGEWGMGYRLPESHTFYKSCKIHFINLFQLFYNSKCFQINSHTFKVIFHEFI